MKPLFPKFDDPAVWQELNKQCICGNLVYRNYPAAEYKYFDCLRLLYQDYKSGLIDKETASELKRRLYMEYTGTKKMESASLEIYGEYQDNIKKYNDLRIKINKAESNEDKLRYALEIVGAITNDGGFGKRNLKE